MLMGCEASTVRNDIVIDWDLWAQAKNDEACIKNLETRHHGETDEYWWSHDVAYKRYRYLCLYLTCNQEDYIDYQHNVRDKSIFKTRSVKFFDTALRYREYYFSQHKDKSELSEDDMRIHPETLMAHGFLFLMMSGDYDAVDEKLDELVKLDIQFEFVEWFELFDKIAYLKKRHRAINDALAMYYACDNLGNRYGFLLRRHSLKHAIPFAILESLDGKCEFLSQYYKKEEFEEKGLVTPLKKHHGRRMEPLVARKKIFDEKVEAT